MRRTMFGLRRLDAAFFDAICRIIPMRGRVCAVHSKKLHSLANQSSRL